ncbi:hypothetical protein HRG_004032 [Hirsutella rhossiliensis]|uniref:Mating-type alpha-pheromone receptor n=1 Tax=Hirsutella rhossiliensis TaxID=111463 RepID=A0A9P8SKL4_9HYPO|nr:uncharacterized protein HRG_04032 [Hirsutella rhossiliensis]KAH0966016.1 hypothetical protein HRG_04032 [Hirsutella rhossiliensis]
MLFRAALAFFFASVALSFCNQLFAVLTDQIEPAALSGSSFGMIKAMVQCFILKSLFDDMAVIFALLAVGGVASGIRLIHLGGRSAADDMLRTASYVLAAILGCINAVIFALSQLDFQMLYSKPELAFLRTWLGKNPQSVLAARLLTFVMLATQSAFALALFVGSVVNAVLTRSDQGVKTAAKYLLVCCVLLVLKTSFTISIWVTSVPLGSGREDSDGKEPFAKNSPGLYFQILEVVLSVWPFFVLLVLLFSLAVKKQDGLWATHQPFMMDCHYAERAPQQKAWDCCHSLESQQSMRQTRQRAHELSGHFYTPEMPVQPPELHGFQLPHELSTQQRLFHQPRYEMEAQAFPPAYAPPGSTRGH